MIQYNHTIKYEGLEGPPLLAIVVEYLTTFPHKLQCPYCGKKVEKRDIFTVNKYLRLKQVGKRLRDYYGVFADVDTQGCG